MASSDLYLSALQPYIGSSYHSFMQALPHQAEFWGQMLPYDHTQFDPKFSIDLMKYYNDKMGLGLTDEQVVAGIKAFGERSAAQWGAKDKKVLDSSSNPVAVAAESIERALALAGKDSGAFWNVAAQDLNKGQAMADDIYRYTNAMRPRIHGKSG